MKILLVGLNVYAPDHYCLGLRYLKVYALKNEDIKNRVRIAIKDFDFSTDEAILVSAILAEKPDLVGFSAFVWNIEKIIRTAQLLKKADRNLRIAVGGPQVSYKPMEILAKFPCLDFVVKGEGEVTFEELVLHLLGLGKSLAEIDGLAFRNNGFLQENRDRDLIEDINQIPSPYLEGSSEGIPGWIAQWETFRGCAYNCAYCTWGRRQLRRYDPKRLKRELEYFIGQKASHILIVDSAISLNKKRLKEHFETILKNSPPIESISAFLHLEDLDPSDVDFYCQLPFSVMEIGLQTINPKALQNIGRVWKKGKFERNWFLIKNNPHRKFDLRVDLIIGLPGDSYRTFCESLRYVVEVLKPDTPSLFRLQLLRGSRLYQLAGHYGIKQKTRNNWVTSSTSYSRQDMRRSRILGFAYYLMHWTELCGQKFPDFLCRRLNMTKFELIKKLALWFEKNPRRLPTWFKDQFLAPKDLTKVELSGLKQALSQDAQDSSRSKARTAPTKNDPRYETQKGPDVQNLNEAYRGYRGWKKYEEARWIELVNDVLPDFIRHLVIAESFRDQADEIIGAFYGSRLMGLLQSDQEV